MAGSGFTFAATTTATKQDRNGANVAAFPNRSAGIVPTVPVAPVASDTPSPDTPVRGHTFPVEGIAAAGDRDYSPLCGVAVRVAVAAPLSAMRRC
jgi:hypothetical protein